MLEQASLEIPAAPDPNFSSFNSILLLDVPLPRAFEVLCTGDHLKSVALLSPLATLLETGDTAIVPVASGSLPRTKNISLLKVAPEGLERTWFCLQETVNTLGISSRVSPSTSFVMIGEDAG